jgi:hypothetical protein
MVDGGQDTFGVQFHKGGVLEFGAGQGDPANADSRMRSHELGQEFVEVALNRLDGFLKERDEEHGKGQ